MQEIGTIAKEHDLEINCIPNNMEKYMAFMCMLGKHLLFLDSFQFMDRWLLIFLRTPSNIHQRFFRMRNYHLWKRKGVYPYDYMHSFQTFDDKQLPPKEQFYSILIDENISDAQYQHAQNVWNTFNMKTMGAYHDLYLKSDILLLADVFENFRKTCLQYYKLDSYHILHLLGYPGMPCWKWLVLNLSLWQMLICSSL